ncbi:hrpB [Symbiodinium natans]|uniref:HrpB protein n=1 Tax=Symbiodinium natans TaxID=878477 RepID=A0A812QN30_9DINO|nr:hrpB [Symbiodinium natans]
MIRALAACAALTLTSASGTQACDNQQVHSKSLLQVHGPTDPAPRNHDDLVGLCVVQDDSCFDLQLDKRWHNASWSKDYEFPPDAVQLVVARHGEDLRWLDALPQLPAVVYNRGGADSLLPSPRENLRIVSEENHGREDEVFLHHIVENYDALPQVTVFLQGWPFGHCPGFLKAVRNTISAMLLPGQVAELQGAADASQGLAPLTGTFWQYNINAGRLGLASSLASKHFPLGREREALNYARVLYNETCTKILGGAACPGVEWTAEGAQWAVTRDRIWSTERSIYMDALSLGEGWEGKFRGLVLEALWPVMFGSAQWKPTKVDMIPSQAGQAFNRARSNDGFCASETSGSRKLLFSCQDRVEFCERQRKSGASTGKLFESERLGFKIHDASDFGPWRLEAKLQPILWGSATWWPRASPEAQSMRNVSFDPDIVELDGLLGLRRSDRTDLAAVQWNITESGSGYAFSRLDFRGQQQFLGCQEGLARLLPEPSSWQFIKLLDGWIQMRHTQAGRVLSMDDRSSEGRLYCREAAGLDSSQAAFVLQTLRK